MAFWFWNWWFFSFFGYLLEKVFARLTGSPKQNRKCFILLPLCPVYGFAVTAMLALPESWRTGWPLLLLSALVPTVVEALMHRYYECFFGVCYWDYRDQPWNWKGRICLPFALVWTALMPLAVRRIAPVLARWIPVIPAGVSLAAGVLLAADWLCSRYLLWRRGDTELLSLPVLLRWHEPA